jgi:hypothetical protein
MRGANLCGVVASVVHFVDAGTWTSFMGTTSVFCRRPITPGAMVRCLLGAWAAAPPRGSQSARQRRRLQRWLHFTLVEVIRVPCVAPGLFWLRRKCSGRELANSALTLLAIRVCVVLLAHCSGVGAEARHAAQEEDGEDCTGAHRAHGDPHAPGVPDRDTPPAQPGHHQCAWLLVLVVVLVVFITVDARRDAGWSVAWGFFLPYS